ncbi:hypothetical protein SAMN02745193_00058 [Erythrobacter sanguineus]|uniref:Uncharacterized protein n=2 Tax=Erythrobacter sanguineus TaxID=198312 RepID=A0A1M7RPM3_9SPHN|nr:hypothetical protein SAMN02745193_00058 [Erythrobacter sanguineus]
MWHDKACDDTLRHPEPITMTRAQTFVLHLPAVRRAPVLAIVMAIVMVGPLTAQQQPASDTPPEVLPETAPESGPESGPEPAPPRLQTPTMAPEPAPVPEPAPLVETPAEPAAQTAAESGQPASPASPAPEPTAPASAPSDPVGEPVFGWVWLAAAAALLAGLIAGVGLWRRRKPKVLHLAAPPPIAEDGEQPALPRLDLALDITAATRSVMMFMIQYRLTITNRTDRAVSDLAVAVQLTSAQREVSNAAPLAAARSLARVERIGPHQGRSITGEVQLPLAAINPIMQGKTALFIPLVHVTLEGEGQQALARSFVVGGAGDTEGRVRPLPLDIPPGSVAGLRARAIEAPHTARSG